MKHQFSWTAALATAAWISTATAHYPISACEKPETTYTCGGNTYKVCPASNYQGTTLYDYHGLRSPEACAQQCSQYQGCTRAVYDTVGGTCHIKGPANQLNWVADDQGAVTIRLDKAAPKPGTPVAACPVDVQTYTSPQGWQYQICPGTDYVGNTMYDVHGLKNQQECANACGRYDGCFKAVFDLVGKTCHLKSACGTSLVTSSKYDSILFINRPGAPSCLSPTTTTTKTTLSTTTTRSTTTTTRSTTTFTTTTTSTTSQPPTTTTAIPDSGLCANGGAPDSIYTASNGDKYGICKNNDFPGGDIQSPVYNVDTIEACSDVCSKTAGCVAVNLHKEPRICYLKGVKNNGVVNSAVDGAYLISAVGGGTKTTAAPTANPSTCAASTVTVTVTKY